MAKIVNLRAARKTAKRGQKRAKGDENAARSGLTKAQKLLDKTQAEKARRMLDAHQKEEPGA